MGGEKKIKIKLKKKGEEEKAVPTGAAAPSAEEKEVLDLFSKVTKLFDRIESMKGVNLEIDEVVLEGVMPPYELISKIFTAPPVAAPAAPPEVAAPAPPAAPPKPKLEEFKFEPPIAQYQGKFEVVTIGATKEEGGTRAFTISVGGNSVPPFHQFEGALSHRPAIAHLVFDEDPKLPKSLRKYFDDVKDDPVEWAKRRVEEYGAKLIFLDLNSTDPRGTNRSADEAAETVKEVLKAVDVPLMIGTRSGNMKKDVEVLKRCAEVAKGENVVLFTSSFVLPAMLGFGVSFADEILEYYKIVAEYGHIGVHYAALNLPAAGALNMTAIEKGVPRNKLLCDIGTMPVGYASDQMISALDSICAKAFSNDENYQTPLIFSPANAWMFREAFAEEEGWGKAEQRGTAWEVATAMSGVMSGIHVMVMLDPIAIRMVESFLDRLYVPKIETVDELMNHMPGVNCKACGYDSCKNFAEAVIEGKEDIEKCGKLMEGGKRTIKRLMNPPKEIISEPMEIYDWIKAI
ncbi:MAG: (Fe-S)-binding protein [Candidatus Methanospirareceae archaeon]